MTRSRRKCRAAVVTGAGRGIGEAIAAALAKSGARVVLAARTVSEVEAVASRLRDGGHEAWALPCDVADESSVTEMAKRAQDVTGGIDVLVNNAGRSSSAPLAKLTRDEWEQTLAVNATGTFLCTRALAPAMLKRKWGRIVNVASTAGLDGARYVSHYSAAKHAVIGFTRSIALEFEGKGVTVNAVCPGYVDTSMTARTVKNVRKLTGASAEEALAAVLASAGQPRLVTPEEVASRVIDLCSDEAASVNGEALVLEGHAGGDMPFEIVNPKPLGEPKGWNNGLLAPRNGRVLFVAGQAGWDASAQGQPPGFAEQFAHALDKVLAVVADAGGGPRDIGRITVYVTHLAAYRDSLRELGALWRSRFGKYYPAMALVEVKGLVDQGAVVEMEATAVIGGN